MNDETLKKGLWTNRSVEDTLQVYADWAEKYDADVLTEGYASPHRIAHALTQFAGPDALILDFGCGTGLSGQALQHAGYHHVDGIDISPEMLSIARDRQIYREVWQGKPGEITNVMPGLYNVIVAAGVISLGAAPPETLSLCLDHLDPGGLLALSFNDPTLDDGSYDAALEREVDAGRIEILFREHGPHLPGKGMGSDVMVLQRL